MACICGAFAAGEMGSVKRSCQQGAMALMSHGQQRSHFGVFTGFEILARYNSLSQ